MSHPFRQAVFTTSATKLSQCPNDATDEIAFAGRSNAGKSSAINVLTEQNGLAKVSRTPGRTQLINFFQVKSGKYLVDLPGYGYSKVPDRVRQSWEEMLGNYLLKRKSLNALILIMDSRHPLTELDRRMIQWVAPTGHRIHILLTKADKLSRQAANDSLRATRDALVEFGTQISVQLFSSHNKQGLSEAIDTLAGLLSPDGGQIDQTDQLINA